MAMSDIKIFRTNGEKGPVEELPRKKAKLEKHLQAFIEVNMEMILGVRLLKSEFVTSNNGRIDTLGIDENDCPVIVEYKRDANANVINQGLFYYDWLVDHKGEYKELVERVLGRDVADKVEWDNPRLICIASGFSRYDEHAIKQIDKNIDLMRYEYFDEDLFLLELVNSHSKNRYSTSPTGTPLPPSIVPPSKRRLDVHEERKRAAPESLIQMYEDICDFALSLGDEVQRTELKFYTALKKIRNFASVQVWSPKKDPSLRIYLHIDPDSVSLSDERVSDVRTKGHWGTGDLEVVVRCENDLELAKQLIEESFSKN
jgi:predicted transport protein